MSYASLNIMLLTACKYKLFSRQLCGLLIFVKFCAPLLPLLVAHDYLSLTNSVYLPPRPNSLNPRLAMAADKPCWTEPPESGTYGDCKVLRLVVNCMAGECASG